MNHITHVRFVDAHAKCDRRANDLDFIADEKLLITRTFFGRQTRVIGPRLNPFRGQFFGGSFGRFAAGFPVVVDMVEVLGP